MLLLVLLLQGGKRVHISMMYGANAGVRAPFAVVPGTRLRHLSCLQLGAHNLLSEITEGSTAFTY